MATFETIKSNTSDNTGSVVVDKPVGLAVGDLMLAGIFVDKDAGSLASINTPSGWTAVHLLDVGSGFSALGVYSKTADSADVAASNFTFTGSGTTASMSMVGHILRISDWGATAGLTYLNDAVVPGVTPSPAVASSLYVVFAGCIDGSAIVDITGVSIANSNPSWTVRGASGVNGSNQDTRFEVFTATRVETTATGDFTVTYASAPSVGKGTVALILTTPISGSVSPGDTDINAYALTGVQSAVLNAIVDEATLRESNPTQWTNETKPTTTWVNETL